MVPEFGDDTTFKFDAAIGDLSIDGLEFRYKSESGRPKHESRRPKRTPEDP